jgi:hypothetical protein
MAFLSMFSTLFEKKYLVKVFIIFILIAKIGAQTNPDFSGCIIDSIYTERLKYSSVDEELLYPAAIAFSHYPELDSTHIIFKYKSMKWMMAARPSPNFIFKPRSERDYFIVVNTRERMNADTLLHIMPFDAKVGIIGHELAHILDYENMTRVELLFFGVKYVVCTRKIERRTDMTTIEHKLGDQLLEYNEFIKDNDLVTKRYTKRRARNYLSPKTVKKMKKKYK